MFAKNEFCEYLKQNKLNNIYQGFELIFIAHTPQNGSASIICKAENAKSIYEPLKIKCGEKIIALNSISNRH